MSVIMQATHNEIVRRLKRRAVLSHGVWFLLVLVLLIYPYILTIGEELTTEAYTVAKKEFDAVLAKQELLAMLRSRPLSVGQSLDICDVVMRQKSVPIPVVLGVIAQESEFKTGAVSEKGARGLMQVKERTFYAYSKNPLLSGPRHIQDPVLNLEAGINYLGDMIRIYKDIKIALRAYYGGPSNAKNKALDSYANAVLKKAERFERR